MGVEILACFHFARNRKQRPAMNRRQATIGLVYLYHNKNKMKFILTVIVLANFMVLILKPDVAPNIMGLTIAIGLFIFVNKLK